MTYLAPALRRVENERCRCTHRQAAHVGGRCFSVGPNGLCRCTVFVAVRKPWLGWALTALVVLVVGLAMGGGW